MKAYRGKAVENGATSIPGKVAPPIRKLVGYGGIRPGMTVLDWGAGKYARNADYLRKMGCKVYAYDPYNSNGTDGWKLGAVSSKKPSRRIKFDVAFSCYVLNVVRVKDEKEIVRTLESYAPVVFHITRNKDIQTMAACVILGKRSNRWILGWWEKFCKSRDGRTCDDNVAIMEFCQFGFCTGPGKFQRIPSEVTFRKYGYCVYVKNNNCMIFQKVN